MNTQDQQFSYDVFISYSTQDREWVRGELLPRLEASGLKACIDYRDFGVGAPIATEIERALLTSRKTLLVLSPTYLGSDWTAFENVMLQTLDPINRTRRLIPLRKAKCDLPLRIAYLIYVDFAEPDDVQFAWERLLNALGTPDTHTASTPPPVAPSQTASTTASALDVNELRQKLIERCSLGDLKDLCFVMGIDDENYSSSKSEFVRELLADLKRQGRLDELVATVRREKEWVLR